MISLDLRLLGNLGYQSLSGMMAVVSVPVVEALGSHELAQVASVSSQTSDGNAHVIVDVEDLLLMISEVVGALLERDQHLKSH